MEEQGYLESNVVNARKNGKITATTDNSEWKAPKKRKPRKPMTDEQKAAASERLAKAREAKLEKNPDYGQTNIHASLRKLPDEHQLSPATRLSSGSRFNRIMQSLNVLLFDKR